MQNITIKQQLSDYLQNGDILTLAKAERKVSFTTIFETKSKPFCNVTDERKLLQSIMKLTQRFISVNFPDVNAQDVSLQFAVDITESRHDWNLLDILHFFKFIRQRQDLPENKIFGNKISPIKLMELTAIYEEHKSIAREIWHKEQISMQIHGTQEQRLLLGAGSDIPKDTRFAELAKNLINKENEKTDKIYENADKTKKFLNTMQVHWDEQMKLLDAGTITEEQAIYNHNKYRLEYDANDNREMPE